MMDGYLDDRRYRFVLDTGAVRSQVVTDDYTAQLPLIWTDRSSAVFGASATSLVRLPDLTIGPVSMTDLEVDRVSSDGAWTRNLLGMDVLASQRLQVNFEPHEVAIAEPTRIEGLSRLDLGSHSSPRRGSPGSSFDTPWVPVGHPACAGS